MNEITLSPLLAKAQTGSLVIETGSLAGQRFVLPPVPGALLLGRERICNVRFDPDRERLVGRTHARIEVRPEGVFLVDLNSANGTFREGGQPVRGSIPLHSGMRFQLGGEGGPWLSVELPQAVPTQAVHASPVLSETPTIVTRPDPIAQHAAPAVLIRPVVKCPVLPASPATAPAQPNIFSANPPSPQVDVDSPRAVSAGSLGQDPQAAAQKRAYFRQIVVIVLILLSACGLGVLIGTSGSSTNLGPSENSVP